jgi:hypothetical protein
MPQIKGNTGGEWSWTQVVLAKSSRSIAEPKQKDPENLSTCPDRRSAGQVDRLVCPFKNPTTVGRGEVLDERESRHCSAALHSSDDKEGYTADIQHAGAIMQEWVEGFARLPPERPPSDVPLRRWHRLINDIADFARDGWVEKAAVLGWTLSDLVGADPERPFARLDKAGLLWLSNGTRLVAMCENTATMETNTGVRQTYRRKPHEPGRVLVWELVPKI